MFERPNREFPPAAEDWDRPGPGPGFGRWWGKSEALGMDLIDRDREFVATVDLPGFEREDIEIEVTDQQLRIEAERETALEEETAHFLRHERRQETISRSVRLPADVDVESVTATMTNGVLKITLPKLAAEEARSVGIDVE